MEPHVTGQKRSTLFLSNTRLRYHRKMRHWTQADLANELRQLCEPSERERGIISVGMISGWERGEHFPSPFWQKKLCTLFATTPDDLGLLEKARPVPQNVSLPGNPPFSLNDSFVSVFNDALHEKLAGYFHHQPRPL